MLDWNTYQSAYQSASPELKAVIDDSRISKAINDRSLSLTAEQRRDLIRGAFLVLSKTITVEQLMPLLQKTGVPLDGNGLQELIAEINFLNTNTSESASAGVRTMAGDAAAAEANTGADAGESDTVAATSQDELLKKPPHPDAA